MQCTVTKQSLQKQPEEMNATTIWKLRWMPFPPSLVLHIFPCLFSFLFFFFLLANCVHCLDIRAWFGRFLNKCLKRCESFNDWIE